MTRNGAGESKSAKFTRLAEARVNKAIKALRSIGNLANKQIYSFDESQLRKIMSALRREVSGVKARFDDADSSRSGAFKL